MAGRSAATARGGRHHADSLGVAALGANCTLGPQGLLDVLAELARWTSLPLTAQPNAGPPTLTDGQFQYTGRPGVLRAPRAALRRARRDAGGRLLRDDARPHRGGGRGGGRHAAACVAPPRGRRRGLHAS